MHISIFYNIIYILHTYIHTYILALFTCIVHVHVWSIILHIHNYKYMTYIITYSTYIPCTIMCVHYTQTPLRKDIHNNNYNTTHMTITYVLYIHTHGESSRSTYKQMTEVACGRQPIKYNINHYISVYVWCASSY